MHSGDHYEETLAYLYAQLPMFTRIGSAAYKKDLHNTKTLCKATGNPHQQFRTIHVAGTNGKGSTSHLLAAILQQSGYKTGLYTSPHIHDFRERIKVNGEMIDKDFVVSFTKKTLSLQEKISPSFFELTVVMAFAYFAEKQVDVAIIETGLGGRLDSTNVITPLLSVITNIGLDHMNLLGNSLAEIAFEKAGIIKPGVPALLGENTLETLPVFVKKAQSLSAPLFLAEKSILASVVPGKSGFQTIAIHDLEDETSFQVATDLMGNYQVKNIRTVLAARKLLLQQGFVLGLPETLAAMARVKTLTGLSGRWDIVQDGPTLIYDVAHNEDGIRAVMQQLQETYPNSSLHFVLGFVNDKSLEKVLRLFPKEASYYFTNAHIPRALPYQDLMEEASKYNLAGSGFDDVNKAIETALQKAQDSDVVMVCGSFFIIAEITTVPYCSR